MCESSSCQATYVYILSGCRYAHILARCNFGTKGERRKSKTHRRINIIGIVRWVSGMQNLFFLRKFRHAKSEHLSLLPGMLITWPCTLTSYRTSKWCGPWTCCWELVVRFLFVYFMTSSSYHVKMKHILLIIGLLWWPEYHLYQIWSSTKFTNDRFVSASRP